MKISGTFFAMSLLVQSAFAAPVDIPAFTAFSEPKADGIEVRERDGAYNWSDGAQSLVWYGDLHDAGALQCAVKLTLPTGEKAALQLQISGVQPKAARQKYILRAAATGTGAEQNIQFGTINIKPGYYRVALSGLKKSGATFGDIKKLVFDGAAATSIASKQGFNFTRWRGQTSVHLTYQLPAEKTYTAFYNEVAADTDPIHTYYCAIGFNAGYFGMQVNTAVQRRVIFSIWDNANEAVSRAKVDEKDRAGLLTKGEKVYAGDFGNEGTGGHSHLKFPWKTGATQRFLVTVKPDGDAAIFAGYYFRPDTQKWMLISAWRRPRTAAKLTGFYSFVEDFGHDQNATRLAHYGNAWVRTSDGKWEEALTARFTRTARNEPVRREWQAGAEKDRLWMQTGGYVTRITDYGDIIKREPSNRPPSDLDLPSLPDQMPPPAPELTLAPALKLLAENKNIEAVASAKAIAAQTFSPEVRQMANVIESLAQPAKIGPAPAAQPDSVKNIFLSDATWENAQVGYNEAWRNRAMVEDPGDFPLLRNSEGIVEKGIFAHAASRIVFNLGGKWQRFTATAGLQRGGSSVVFVVKGDGRVLYRSPLLQGEETAPIDIKIAGVKSLELITEDGGDGIGSDWSVWFSPQISR